MSTKKEKIAKAAAAKQQQVENGDVVTKGLYNSKNDEPAAQLNPHDPEYDHEGQSSGAENPHE